VATIQDLPWSALNLFLLSSDAFLAVQIICLEMQQLVLKKPYILIGRERSLSLSLSLSLSTVTTPWLFCLCSWGENCTFINQIVVSGVGSYDSIRKVIRLCFVIISFFSLVFICKISSSFISLWLGLADY
jgi:hypothetical protein